jgi:hypothetical protein
VTQKFQSSQQPPTQYVAEAGWIREASRPGIELLPGGRVNSIFFADILVYLHSRGFAFLYNKAITNLKVREIVRDPGIMF